MNQKFPVGILLLLVTIQFLLSMGLIGFWMTERDLIQDAFQAAKEKTVDLQAQSVTDPVAKGIIVGQQVQIRNLGHAHSSGNVFIGYMAALAVVGLLLTLMAAGFAWRGNRSRSKLT